MSRKMYYDMTPTEQEQLHRWFDEHGVDHTIVPVDPRIDYDGDAIHVWVLRQPKRLDVDGNVETFPVTIYPTRSMPWPQEVSP